MNKDTVVASVIGFSLGLVAAIGLWVVPRLLPKNTAKAPEQQEEQQQPDTQTADTKSGFTLTEPTDGEITKTDSIKVSGTAAGAEFILITTPAKNILVTPGSGGEFSTSVDISQGVNVISVTRIANQQEETKQLKVYSFSENI